jgi:hypothetical protein
VIAVAKDVHEQFAVVGVGDLEDVAAVFLEAALLPRVPLLGGDPSGRARRRSAGWPR